MANEYQFLYELETGRVGEWRCRAISESQARAEANRLHPEIIPTLLEINVLDDAPVTVKVSVYDGSRKLVTTWTTRAQVEVIRAFREYEQAETVVLDIAGQSFLFTRSQFNI